MLALAIRIGVAFGLVAWLAANLPALGQEPTRRWIRDIEGKQTAVEQVYPHSYALLVGINKYVNFPRQNLDCAVNDVVQLKQQLIASYGFPDKNITVLLDAQATKQQILHALSAFSNTHKIQLDDRVLIFFSGHGQTMTLPNADNQQMGYLIPADAQIDLEDTTNLAPYNDTCIKMRDIWDTLAGCPARHVLLIADACYAGLLASSRGLKGMSSATLAAWLAQPARIVMAAGGKGEESAEDPAWGHGAFTKALLEQLRKRAADPGRVFTTTELFADIQGEVKDLTEGKQTPQLCKHEAEGEFLFVTTSQSASGGGSVTTPHPMPGGKVVAGSTKALLTVTTMPTGATVYVDRKPVGKTPMSLPIEMELDDTRDIAVGVKREGYKAQKFTVTLRAGSETPIVATLEKSAPEPLPDKSASNPLATADTNGPAQPALDHKAPAIPTSLVATDAVRAQIESALQQAGNADIQAQGTLNPAPLEKVYTGEALRRELENLEALQMIKQVVDAHLKGTRQFDRFNISPDGSHATVHTLESWDISMIDASTHKLLSHRVDIDRQTYYLVHQAGVWMVEVDLMDNDTSMTPANLTEAEILSAIKLADDVEARANAFLDTTPLEKVYSGEALRIETSKVEEFRAKSLVPVGILTSLKVQKLSINAAGNRATVAGVETWDFDIYTLSEHKRIAHIPNVKQAQTYYLVHTPSGWMLDNDVPTVAPQ